MKLRLTGKGFENYTGQVGVALFKDGLSVFDVNPNDAIRLACTIGAEWENGAPANVGDIYTQNLHTPAPTIEQQCGLDALRTVVGIHNADDALTMTNKVANPTTAKIANEPEAPQQEIVEREKYTAESLAEIADKSGIVGLREIANEFGVTGNSIATLIERIIKKQG